MIVCFLSVILSIMGSDVILIITMIVAMIMMVVTIITNDNNDKGYNTKYNI